MFRPIIKLVLYFLFNYTLFDIKLNVQRIRVVHSELLGETCGWSLCSKAKKISLPTFRIPHFTHHSAEDFRTVHSAFYFPHSAIPHFTGTRSIMSKTHRANKKTFGKTW